MVSTRQKRQSNRWIHSRLDDFYQDTNMANTVSDRQENGTVNESTGDQEFTVGDHENKLTANKNAVNVKILEMCFNERIDREKSKSVDPARIKPKTQFRLLLLVFLPLKLN